MCKVRQTILKVLSALLPKKCALRLARWLSSPLLKSLDTALSEDLLLLLLDAMEVFLILDRDFHRNIVDFEATICLTTRQEDLYATAVFSGGRMHVKKMVKGDATAEVIFKDAAALRRNMFTLHQDLLQSALNYEVELMGNWNYLYKFFFMSIDLEKRLHLV